MKKIIASLLAFIAVIVLSLQAGAAYITTTDGFREELAERINIINDEDWLIGPGAESMRIRRSGAFDSLYIAASDGAESVSVSYAPEKFPDVSEYNELCFDMNISSGKECEYTLTYYYGSEKFSDSITSETNGRNVIRFKLPEEAADSIERISLTVKASSGTVKSFSILAIYGDDCRTYSYVDRFESYKVETELGETVYYDEYIAVVPGKSGAVLNCLFNEGHKGATALVTVTVYSPYAGIITVENKKTGKSQTAAMYRGTGNYSFAVSELSDSLSISFSSGDTEGGDSIRFIALSTVNITDQETKTYGNVESCIYDNGKIRVKGSISSETAVQYIKCKLALYKIPNDGGEEYELSEPEAEMSISTSFTLDVAVDYDYTEYKYVVAIADKDKIIPISSPVCAFAKASLPAVLQETEVGLADSDSVTVFEARADKVIIDVYVDRLVKASLDADKTVRVSYHDSVFYLDSDYISELSSEIDFCISTGCGVYLRLVRENEAELSRDAVDAICVSSAYLAEKCPNISGIIAPKGKTADVLEAAKGASELLAELTAAVRRVNGQCELIFAVGEDDSELAVMVAYFNKKNGVDNVGLCFETTDDAESIVAVKALADSASAVGSAFRHVAVVCESVGGGDGTAEKEMYDAAVKASISSVLFGFDDGLSTDDIVAVLKNVRGDSLQVYELTESAENVSYNGKCSLWNFADSYDTFGWLAGGSCSAPQTVKASVGGGRAMKSVYSNENGEEGILVRWMDEITDFSAGDGLSIALYTESEADSLPVTVVLGADTSKAEYKVEVMTGASVMEIDLEGFEQVGNIEYMAIILNADHEAVLEITDISIVSRSMTDLELKDMLAPNDQTSGEMATVYIFFGAVISATVIVFVILTKKKSGREMRS